MVRPGRVTIRQAEEPVRRRRSPHRRSPFARGTSLHHSRRRACMSTRLVWTVGLALLLAGRPAPAAGPPDPTKPPAPADVQALAEKIDQHVARRWEQFKAKPAATADDA